MKECNKRKLREVLLILALCIACVLTLIFFIPNWPSVALRFLPRRIVYIQVLLSCGILIFGAVTFCVLVIMTLFEKNKEYEE